MTQWLLWMLLPVALVYTRDPPGSAKARYYVSLQRELSPCDNFNNSVVDVARLLVEKSGMAGLAVVGNITVNKDLEDLGYHVDVFTDRNSNWEYLMTYEDKDLCQRIMDKDMVWSAFVKAMGISGCPIKKDTYSFKEATLIDISKFSLSAENTGLYRGIAHLLQGGKRISCHSADVAIST